MPTRPKQFVGAGQQEAARRYEHDRNQLQWRKWYKSPRWLKIRKLYLAQNPLCAECEKLGRTVPATILDHIIPHRGNEALFFEPTNRAGLCKRCHDSKTRRGE